MKTPTWFVHDDDRPIFAFTGILESVDKRERRRALPGRFLVMLPCWFERR